MEGKAATTVRRGSGSAIYEKYLNIKNSELPNEEKVAPKYTEISNSTDKQELEAGEVVRTNENEFAVARLGASIRKTDDGRDVTTSSRIEERGEPRSPRMRQPVGPVSPPRITEGSRGPLRGRSRSRSQSRRRNGNGMLDDMNGGGRPWPPPQGPSGDGGRFEGFHSGGHGYLGPRSPRGRYDGRPGSPPCCGFDRRPGSPPRGGYGRSPDSLQRNGSGGGRSPPRGDFGGVRERSRRDGYDGPGGPRGCSPPFRGDFRRGRLMSPGRDGPPDFRDRLGPGWDSPRGRMMRGHGPGGPRRSRSRSSFSRDSLRGPPRNGDVIDDHGPGGPPSYEYRGLGRFSSPSRGGDFGPRFGYRSPSMNGCGSSSGRDGLSNMFRPRGRSRSPNRPSSNEMMRKRDRSWEHGGPLPSTVQRPLTGPLPDSPRMMEPQPFDTPSEWNFELRRSGKVKCRCSATSLSVGISRQLPLYLDVVTLPHLKRSPEFLQLERPNVRRVVYELKPESMADASGYREFVDYLVQGRGGHARAGAATEMEPQGFKIFLLPPGQAARQLGYKGDHMVAVLRSR